MTEEEVLRKSVDKGKQAEKASEDKGNDSDWRSVSYRRGWKNGGYRNVSQGSQYANRGVNNVRNANSRSNGVLNEGMASRNDNQASSSKAANVKYVPFGSQSSKESDGFENVSNKNKVKVNETGDDSVMGFEGSTNTKSNEIVKEKMKTTGSSRNHVMPEVKETWTDEMVDYYEAKMDQRKSDRVNGHYDSIENAT
ncbi:hypothetical protein Tco_1050003, partial [Tanacetum coccineum]